MSNKYHYDVLNCHYCKGAKNDNGSIEYGTTVKALVGLVSMDMSPEGETSKIRADGIDYIVYTSNNGYTGTLNFVKVDDEFRKDCMAEKVDETTGILLLIVMSDEISPSIQSSALMPARRSVALSGNDSGAFMTIRGDV